MSQTTPIGVFDSGFGGLTVFKSIRRLLPQYDYIYLGDNARTPYGNRSFEAVLKFATEGVDYLFRQGCPLVIIACNTASAKALRSLQQNWLPRHYPERRVLGVIRPTVESIRSYTRNNKVALWATAGTVRSQSFAIEIEKYAPGIALAQQPCPMLVPLVEAGELEGEGLDYFIKKYWQQTQSQIPNIDALLLACTHYPLILSRIKALIPQNVRVISQDEIVPPSLKYYLNRHPEHEVRVSKNGGCRYLTTDACEHFDHLGEIFMGQQINSEKVAL
jgi:glutamate racemase